MVSRSVSTHFAQVLSAFSYITILSPSGYVTFPSSTMSQLQKMQNVSNMTGKNIRGNCRNFTDFCFLPVCSHQCQESKMSTSISFHWVPLLMELSFNTRFSFSVTRSTRNAARKRKRERSYFCHFHKKTEAHQLLGKMNPITLIPLNLTGNVKLETAPDLCKLYLAFGCPTCSMHVSDCHWFRLSESPTNITFLPFIFNKNSLASNLQPN